MMDGRYFADGALSCNWFTVREIGNDSSVHASTISEVAVYAKTEDARLDSHPENPEDEHTASFIDHKISYYLNAVKAVSGRNLT